MRKSSSQWTTCNPRCAWTEGSVSKHSHFFGAPTNTVKGMLLNV